MDDALIKGTRHAIYSSIGDLSDLDFQRLTWLDDHITNPHYSYVEFVECFYDVAAGNYYVADPKEDKAPFAYLLGEGGLAAGEFEAIWNVHLALMHDEQPDDYDHKSILKTQSWLAVVEAAQTARAVLMKTARNEHEVSAMNGRPSLETAREPWP